VVGPGIAKTNKAFPALHQTTFQKGHMTLTITRGDTVALAGIVSDDDGLVNVSTASFRFTAQSDYAETDGHAIIVKTSDEAGGIQILDTGANDANKGKFLIQLTSDDTSGPPPVTINLLFDCQMAIGGVVSTVAKGLLIIEPDCSITVP
jgi:hypothetical protein